ncbi:PIN domain-containing protein [Marinobacterium weihaiense]|uniref:NYN domain-containing protein n=1 Tax=Marinobacterium weihaiense TaxID=2851016 RepID=A0ABS6MBY0_9GAMM|nr:PIN domain-containing protein [Marinobacterium weihaiense]MBV0933816.1 NYN domain-containing protein [Marinobacterium weihaiense]
MNDLVNTERLGKAAEAEMAVVSKVMLIDLENCPKQLQNLPEDINIYSRVVICHAHANAKIPLNWITLLAEAITAGRLKIQQMEKGGKNAADFGICFLAGALMQELAADTHFVIVSDDKDLDHAVHLLQAHQRSAERIGLAEQADSGAQAQLSEALPKTEASMIATYSEYLRTNVKARPAKAATLQNSIKSRFRISQQMTEKLYKSMVSHGLFCVVNHQIRYSESRIRILAQV